MTFAAQAFILGDDKVHYRTMNRGDSWASFETALPPSISANTLSFHANQWEWILFTGQSCESTGGWKGRICHDEVRSAVRVWLQLGDDVG